MGDLERFMDQTVSDLRKRVALLNDGGERRALEDGIALLTDYRLAGIDERRFMQLIATLQAGRSPFVSVLKPQAVARELAWRWYAYAGGAASTTRGY
jgi:hypothetical protein